MPEEEDLPLASASALIELIGGFAVVREIGAGSTGHVYACRDLQLGRDVAIKILREDLLHDDVAVQRFRREGQMLAKIDSPHVVRVFDIGLHARRPYIVMELVEGKDAGTILAETGPFELGRALDVGRQVALGLAAAHKAGVIHRDVKPGNVMLTEHGAKLTDFGLAVAPDGSARLTQAAAIPGTAAFLAPERIRGDSDARTDIYSLGCTLHALISGSPPFVRGALIEVVSAHLLEPAPRLASVPDDVADLVELMLYKAPERRPQTAEEVAQKLGAIIARREKPTVRSDLAQRLEELLGADPIPESPAEQLEVPRAQSATSTLRWGVDTVPLTPHVERPHDAGSDGPVIAPSGAVAPPITPDVPAPQATGVAGSLARMSVAELLQPLEQSASTACIELRRPDGATGAVAIEKGRLVYAKADEQSGVDAFVELMTWRDGLFQVHYDRPAASKNLDASPQALMLEAFRRIDERAGPTVPAPPSAGAASSASMSFVSASLVVPPSDVPATGPPAKPSGAAQLAQTLREHGLRAVAELRRVTHAGLERSAPLRAEARDRWQRSSPRARVVVGSAGALVVVALVALLVSTESSTANSDATEEADIGDWRERIANGEARAVLAELDALPASDREPSHDLVRGHALVAGGEAMKAIGAYSAAAAAGVVDAEAESFLVKALDEHPADAAIDVLVKWPGDAIVARLKGVVETGEWWERHNALIALEKRKQDDGVDVSALAVRDLSEGPSCSKRKHGLTLLKQRGKGPGAIKAIDDAQRRRGNECISFFEYDEARRSIRGRGSPSSSTTSKGSKFR